MDSNKRFALSSIYQTVSDWCTETQKKARTTEKRGCLFRNSVRYAYGRDSIQALTALLSGVFWSATAAISKELHNRRATSDSIAISIDSSVIAVLEMTSR